MKNIFMRPSSLKFLIVVSLLFFFSLPSIAQIAANKCKFLGNIVPNSGVPSEFTRYWNQVTPENAGKWGSVEASRDNMSWSTMDATYNLADDNNFPFKWHTFVWENQQPGWIDDLSEEEQREEVEEWIRLFAERYPETDYIDVVNEPLHTTPSYAGALGGKGSTGWDWVIWAFKKAREYFPDAKLLINDYGIINNVQSTNDYLYIIEILQDSSLIDGIGVQGHFLEESDTSTLRSNLDKLGETGLPVYVSEFDINIADDREQEEVYQEKFLLIWEHSAVEGVTLWGYIEGQIWREDAYLIQSDGTQRPAMNWLNHYVKTGPNFCEDTSASLMHTNQSRQQISVYPNPVTQALVRLSMNEPAKQIQLLDTKGNLVDSWDPSGQKSMEINMEDKVSGMYMIRFIFDGGQINRKIVVK